MVARGNFRGNSNAEAGNPGRHDLDRDSELNYPFIAKAIADLGYTGWMSHEYSPAQGRDWKEALKAAIALCDAA